MDPVDQYQLDHYSYEKIVVVESIKCKVTQDHVNTQNELDSIFIIAQNALRGRYNQVHDNVPDWDRELGEFYDQFIQVIADRQFEAFQFYAVESTEGQDGALARIQSIIDQSDGAEFFEQTMHMKQIHKIEEQHAHMQKRLSEIFSSIQDSLKRTHLQLLDEVKGVSTPERLELLKFYDDSMRLITTHKTNAFQQFVAKTLEAQDNTLSQIQFLVSLVLNAEWGFMEQMVIAQQLMNEHLP